MFPLLIAAGAALTELLLSSLLLWQPHPGVVLLSAVAVGLVRTPAEGMIAAFAGGLLLDLAGGLPLGRQTLPLLIGTTLVFLRYSELARRTVLAPVVASAVATLLYWVFLGIVETLLGRDLPWGDFLLRWAVPAALVNMVLIWPAVIAVSSLSFRARSGIARRP